MQSKTERRQQVTERPPDDGRDKPIPRGLQKRCFHFRIR
jgi:hypothetical protein